MTFEFDGQSYQPDEILPTLRDAAQGFSRASDPDGRMNPETWALAFANAAAMSPLRDSLAQAVRALYAGPAGPELRLAQQIQGQHPLLSAHELWDLLLATSDEGLAAGGDEVERGRVIASSLLANMARGLADVDPRAWSLLSRADLDASVRGPLLRVVGALEPARAAGAESIFIGADESDTLRRIQYAVSSAGSDALTRFVDTLAPRLDAAGHPLSSASRAALGEMAEARRKAGR